MPSARRSSVRAAGGSGLAHGAPRGQLDHLRDRRPRGARRPRARCSWTPPSTATSRSRTSVTSRKLGQPVGACRMCLVEIEGIPKLQTSCSTPVRDGMVVNTTSDRVKHAQNAVVEFLLVNHPLDCPVCDKGGECPLQDISFGWGAGRSRFIEPKRHFKKPLELSPLVAIDRERCILCYRCVRFSQEVAEDYQLVFLERGDHTFVGTHDGRPYVGPFSGNIIELCPVGALTSHRLPLPRAPVGHRGRGLGLHAVPEPVQRRASPCATTPRSCACSRATTRRSTTAGCATRAASATRPFRSPERLTRADGARRRLAARGVVGARAVRGRRGAEEGGRARRGPGRRREPPTRRASSPAPDARGPRLGARRLARRGARSRAPSARVLARPDLSARVSRHRPRRRDPGARHRARRRGADPRPARAQGGRGATAPSSWSHEPRPRRSTRTRRRRCASRPAAPRRRWPR